MRYVNYKMLTKKSRSRGRNTTALSGVSGLITICIIIVLIVYMIAASSPGPHY